MAGHYAETAWKRGRPQVEIPPDLITILDTTLRQGKDYVVEAEEDDYEAGELIRYGTIYARRKGLSFRYYFCQNRRGVSQLRFRLAEKRTYVKRNSTYWDGR